MAFLGSVSLVAIMLVVGLDVAMRYAFRSPITGVTELVGLYLMVLVFYSTLSYAYARNSHIRVDLLTNVISPRLRHGFEAIVCITACAVFVLLAWPAAIEAHASFVRHEVLAGLIPWPTWLPPAFVAAGSVVIACRLLLSTVAHLFGLAGADMADCLPPAHGADFTE